MANTYRIVVIPGDGIGPSIVDASLEVLRAVQQKLESFEVDLDFREGGAGLYKRDRGWPKQRRRAHGDAPLQSSDSF